MGKIIVGIGEAATSGSTDDEIKTLALGSCVALVFLDPKTRVGGMVHVALPESKIDVEKGKKLPGYFADTGLPHLINLMKAKGSTPHSGYITKLIGGANVMDKEDHFQIGKRNVTALKKLLWELNLPITAEEVGGNISRTVSIEMQNGKVFIYSADGKKWSI
jgi:chemotaxis protein CheD